MRPRLIIDKALERPATIIILEAITEPTLIEPLPADLTTLLTQLENIPATVQPYRRSCR